MSKRSTIETAVVGRYVWRMSAEIENDPHAGQTGEVVAAFVEDGSAAFTVLYDDGFTERLWLNCGGVLFLMAADRERLPAMVRDFAEAHMQHLNQVYGKSEYVDPANLRSLVLGDVHRKTGLSLKDLDELWEWA